MPTRGADIQANSSDISPTEAQLLSPPLGERRVKVSSVVLVILVIAAAFMVTALALVFVQRSVERLSPITQPVIVVQPTTSTVTAQPITSTVSIPALPTYEDLMATQKIVLETTSRAVESINRTADLMLTVNAFLFTVMTAAGAGALWKASSAVDEAGKAAQRAAKSLELVQTVEQSVEELEAHSGDLNGKQESLRQAIEEAREQLEEFVQEQEKHRELAEKDRVMQKRTLAVLQLDEYGMSICSGDPGRKWKAVSGALEMSTREDDIIRRKAVKVLGVVEECDQRIIERLEDMAALDPARGVRQEAKKALEKLQHLCEEKNAE
jgi:vacuolar-type H+-ATPase subunit I/STV1